MEKSDYMELAELREQLAELKGRLAQEQIISERAILDTVRQQVTKINRSGRFYIFMGIFALLYCCRVMHEWGFSDQFVAFTGLLLAACAGGTVYLHHGLMTTTAISRKNLVQIASKLVRFRRLLSRWHFFSLPMLAVWIAWFYHEAMLHFEQVEYVAYGAGVGVVVGGVIGLYRHFKTLRETDQALESLRELMHEE